MTDLKEIADEFGDRRVIAHFVDDFHVPVRRLYGWPRLAKLRKVNEAVWEQAFMTARVDGHGYVDVREVDAECDRLKAGTP